MTAAQVTETVTLEIPVDEITWLAHALEIACVVTASNSDTYLVASRLLRQLGHTRIPCGGDAEPTPRKKTPMTTTDRRRTP